MEGAPQFEDRSLDQRSRTAMLYKFRYQRPRLRHRIAVDLLANSFQPFALMALTPLPMGKRNTAALKLTIPDLTTAVPTVTITDIGAGSSFREPEQPEIGQKA